ncbi:TerB family tellurite resistance protein [Verrucomicrobia bacterium]|nr:TerB family tellurite resistance protein [Verrucomicrobiota bacterium]
MMEFIYVVIGYFVLVGIIGWIKGLIDSNAQDVERINNHRTSTNDNSGTHTPSSTINISPQLKLRTSLKTQQTDGINLKLILFELSDLLISKTSRAYGVELTINDITSGKAQPVLCAIDELSQKDSPEFEFKQDFFEIGADEEIHITDHLEILQVPVDLLGFPNKGKRKIKCTLKIHQYPIGGTILFSQTVCVQTATSSIEVISDLKGYLDGTEDKIRYQQIAINLAMHIAASDGNLSPDEAKFIKHWAKEQLKAESEQSKEQAKTKINTTIRNAYSAATGAGIDIIGLTKELKGMESTAWKYKTIELCLDIMKADGVADSRELTELKNLSERIGLDNNRYQALLDRRIASVGSIKTDSESSNFGIKPSMSKDEIKRILNKEFKKWNARASHTNPEIKKNAEKMILIIAEERKNHL